MRAYLPGIVFLLILIGIPIVLHRTLRPGLDFEGGTELIYAVDGDAAVVAAILDERLEAYGATADADVVDGLIRVRVAATEHERLPAIRELLVAPGGLEFRITVEPAATEHYDAYWTYWETFQGEGAGDVAPVESDRSRYPEGLRWYPLSPRAADTYSAARRPGDGEPWVLCALDPYEITDEALYQIRAQRNHVRLGDDWAVHFRIKKLYQASLARLTEFEPDKYMAIIVNGEVLAAPILNSALSDTGQISGAYSEEEARRLAATLAGRLPAVPVLESETPIPE